MTRKDLVLAALSKGDGALFTPVQTQKLFFLIDRNIARFVDGPHFNFVPLHYGPFDKAVYEVLEELAGEGMVELIPDRSWTSYRLTEDGRERGTEMAASLSPVAGSYVDRAVRFVRSLSFPQLVSAIYKAYPEMRENSVFQG